MAAQRPPFARSATLAKAQSSLEILQGMGFPKNRAEKALAATGDTGVQAASDWILNHVFDPEMDKQVPRDYVVYGVPLGRFGAQLGEFWDTSLAQCGRNGAHKSFPHVTLCQFFKCGDGHVPALLHCLQTAVNSHKGECPKEIALQPFSSASYIGLFVEESSCGWFRKVMSEFAAEAAKKIPGCKIEPHKKQLHLTMAYQFLANHQAVLDAMAKKINPKTQSRWELRLYSRDPRMEKAELYRVLYSHAPRSDDELELNEDDFVMVNPDAPSPSVGWVMGASHETGVTGVCPANYIERCQETDVWTLHRSWPATATNSDSAATTPTSSSSSNRFESRKRGTSTGEDSHYDSPEGLFSHDVSAEYAKVVPKKQRAKKTSSASAPRSMLIVRHAERVDVTFGHQWLQYSFDRDGTYYRKNLNMPVTVPVRKGGPDGFVKDSPITAMGVHEAHLTGEAMREHCPSVTQIYASPALRCVQTAHAILQGARADASVQIRVEPGLFEWMAWCQNFVPSWMPVPDLAAAGLRVDMDYKPLYPQAQLDLKEKVVDYYKRSSRIVRDILKAAPPGALVLIVGHAGTLDACTRQLIGGEPRNSAELTKVVQKIPYCGVCYAEEVGVGEAATWQIACPPFPPLTHAPNPRYDWRSLRT